MIFFKYNKIIISLSFLIFSLLINFSLADTGGITNTGGPQLENPLGGNGPTDIFQFIGLVLAAVVRLGAAVVVFFVIYSGFLFVMAQGNEEKLKTAKKAFLYTMIGAAVLLGAQLIALVIGQTITEISHNQ